MANYWLNPLSMWSNGEDYVIARNLQEAHGYVVKVMFGGDSESFYDLERDGPDWYKVDPNINFTYRNIDGTDVVKTIQEFIDINGAGYFANSEY